jgi:hypothetical protein
MPIFLIYIIYKDNNKIEIFITIRKQLLDKANKLVENTKITPFSMKNRM